MLLIKPVLSFYFQLLNSTPGTFSSPHRLFALLYVREGRCGFNYVIPITKYAMSLPAPVAF